MRHTALEALAMMRYRPVNLRFTLHYITHRRNAVNNNNNNTPRL